MKRLRQSRMRLILAVIAVAFFALPVVSLSQTPEWTIYNTTNSGLPYNGVIMLAMDAQENLWIGTGRWFALAGGGLAKFDGSDWTVYNTSNSPLPHNDHFGLAIDPQGNVWSGTEGGLAKFDGTNWTVYNTSNSGLPDNRVATPVFDDQGHLWAGTWEGGLVEFDGVTWTIYNTANSGIPNNVPFATAFDRQGNLWIGTVGGGLVKFDGANWTVFNMANSPLPNNTIYYMCFDSRENLWIATDGGGLAKFDGTNWTIYNTSNSGLSSDRSWISTVDAYDNVWVGTADSGMAVFNGTEWAVYNTSNSPLPDNVINYILTDDKDNIWIGTQNGGLVLFRPRPVVDFNGDGIIDIKDLLKIIQAWGQEDPVCDIAPVPLGDGIVDALDLEFLMSYWGQSVDDSTLIAHWKLDETEGSAAADSAGTVQADLYGDPQWQPEGGMVGGALLLDGIDDFVGTWNIPGIADGDLSVFAWIKGGAPGQVIISQFHGVNWLIADESEGFLATDLTGGGRSGNQPLVSDVTITDGDWHRVGIIWDGTNRTLYVDGLEAASDTQSSLNRSETGLNFGCDPDSTAGTFFSGLIDDVRIYNRAITP